MRIAITYNADTHLKPHLNEIERLGEDEVAESARDVHAALAAAHHCALLPVGDCITTGLQAIRDFAPDLVFNLCEGVLGRTRWEAHFVLALDLLRIPYCGCDAVTIALCQDKGFIKHFLQQIGVYTPPGYETDPGRRYPVLYLFHGTGDTEATWTEFGRAHLILDNLIAAGKAVPMILAMPDGHADLQEEEGDHKANFIRFEADVLESLLPLVDSTYRTLPTPAGRAINGLSMGGMQSLEIGLKHPELFGYVGDRIKKLRASEFGLR